MKEIDQKHNKVLIISDLHGLMQEFLEFLQYIKETYNDTIAYAIHLGDFWKGRNVINGVKTYNFCKDPSILKDLPFILFLLKGNEDINIPESFYHVDNLFVLPHLEIFYLNGFKTIPIHYFENTKKQLKLLGIEKIVRLPRNKVKNINKRNDNKFKPLFDYITKSNNNSNQNQIQNIFNDPIPIDFILTHIPPFGLLNKTRDAITHNEIRFTGNRLVRLIIDKRRPKIVFFGHNHHMNYLKFEDMLIIALDKLVRKSSEIKYIEKVRKSNDIEKNLFNYVIIEQCAKTTLVKMVKLNRLIATYDLKSQQIIK